MTAKKAKKTVDNSSKSSGKETVDTVDDKVSLPKKKASPSGGPKKKVEKKETAKEAGGAKSKERAEVKLKDALDGDAREGIVGGKARSLSERELEQLRKRRAIQDAVAGVEKKFGKGSVIRLGDKRVIDVPVISTGSPKLDRALGIGGLPRGRVCEVVGPESSGKTTLALHLIAEVQRQGEFACMIDAEHALDTKYAGQLGVDVENLYLSQPDYGEQALEIADSMIRTGSVGIVVIDSVPALVPKSELDGDMGDTHVGLQARMMNQALRKLTSAVSQTGTLLLFINQIRMKIGISFGSPETTPGGKGLPYAASVRLDIRRRQTLKRGNDIYGNATHVKVIKNKMAAPFKEVDLEIVHGYGFDLVGEVLDLCVEDGIIEKGGGGVYKYGGEVLARGREQMKELLREDQELLFELREKLLS